MILRLQIQTGQEQSHSLEFRGPQTLVLGRSSKTDVQIHDERISRRHCSIDLQTGLARLRDMGSGNGTFLNGKKIGNEVILADGDVVRLGRSEIQVALGTAESRGAGDTTLDDMFETRAAPGSAGLHASPEVTTCAFCQNLIPPALVSLAVQYRGRYLCFSCSPQLNIPGYRLTKALGEGASGTVYQAIHLEQNVPVAIKVLKSSGQVSEEDQARFVREVMTVEQLNHPNVVRVLAHGEVRSSLYYVMEYVEGKSLRGWIREQGALPLPLALRISLQLALALNHAHERNIVHRDIKPENIIVQTNGHAKLADFGLAKNMATSGSSGLTRPGEGMGTLPYMPPEQIEDALHADQRSDIYSLGATIYHMLTGKPPFSATTPVKFFHRIRYEEPDAISSFREDVPEILTRMIMKCLSKKPDERYQVAADLVDILQQFLQLEFDSRKTAG